MSKLLFIETNNSEKLALYFFAKGVEFSYNREFGKAAEFFKESLDLITCDCCFYNCDQVGNNLDDLLVDMQNRFGTEHPEYTFVKAVMMVYLKKSTEPKVSLEIIDDYLCNKPDEYGFYLKGKILERLNNYNDSYKYYLLSHEISGSSKTLYRLGRIKEFMGEEGLSFLYQALVKSSSSSCCARELKYSYNKSSLTIDDNISTSELESLFARKKIHIEFWLRYSRTLNFQIKIDNTIDEIRIIELKQFISYLKKFEDLFFYDTSSRRLDGHYYNHSETNYYENDYYNDALDMDQQSADFWDNL